VRHSIFPIVNGSWKLGIKGLLTDVTELKHLEAEHLRVSEREQNRIGQELHDDLCQVLAGLSCLTRVLENRLAPRLPEEVGNLREINQQMVDAIDRTRALTHGLYPASMRSGDLRPTLLELVNQVQIRFGVKIDTSLRGPLPHHDVAEVLQVYRVAQEAISNAIRHGGARRIKLALERDGSMLCLKVQDDGTGFPRSQTPHEGIGLQIMRYRANQLGAKLHVGNAPRRGAVVMLHYQPAAMT
jgi:signal transduction histidine kinase